MSAKACRCDECIHFNPSWAAGALKLVCDLKHKPRFYHAKTGGVIPGWKRKCGDFEQKEK